MLKLIFWLTFIVRPKSAEEKNADAITIIQGLGGKANIETVDNCFTRLRVTVKDENLIQEDIINRVKNSGIKRKGKDIQIIFGMQVAAVRGEVEDALEKM